MEMDRTRKPGDVHESALAALERRALTASELRSRLLGRGFAPGDVDAELTRLGNAGLVDDRAVAYNLARYRAGEGRRGPRRVRDELLARGVARELASEAVAEAFPREATEEALARAFQRETRGGAPASRAERERLVRRLVRAGFPVDRVLERLQSAGAEPDELPDPPDDET
jgi:regulatory protein